MYQNPFIQADIAANTPAPQVVQVQNVVPGLPGAPNVIVGVDPALAGGGNPDLVPGALPGDTPILNVDSLWQTPVNADGTPIVPAKPDTYLPDIPAEKLTQMFGSLDFTQSLQATDLTAIASGGEPAVAALKNILNGIGRQVALVNFRANTGMIERGLGNAKDRFLADVPGITTDLLAENALATSNPLMARPKYQPLVANVRTQLQMQNPKANAAAIESGVKRYFDDMAKDMGAALATPKTQQPQNSSNRRTMQDGVNADWDAWGNA